MVSLKWQMRFKKKLLLALGKRLSGTLKNQFHISETSFRHNGAKKWECCYWIPYKLSLNMSQEFKEMLYTKSVHRSDTVVNIDGQQNDEQQRHCQSYLNVLKIESWVFCLQTMSSNPYATTTGGILESDLALAVPLPLVGKKKSSIKNFLPQLHFLSI